MKMSFGLLAFTAVVAFHGPAVAQDRAPGPERPWAEMSADMQARRDQRAADISLLLRLRPDQQASLTSLLAAGPREPLEHRGPRTELTTPQRLDELDRRLQERTERIAARIKAFRAFYAGLTPEQQHAFDALRRLEGARLHGPVDRMAFHRGPGGPGPEPIAP